MTSKSAEIYKLAYSSFIHNKINFANFIGELMLNCGTSDETKLLLKGLGYDKSISNNNKVQVDRKNGLKVADESLEDIFTAMRPAEGERNKTGAKVHFFGGFQKKENHIKSIWTRGWTCYSFLLKIKIKS